MLIKFESKKTAPFVMQSEIAMQLLVMAGQNNSVEGSISGAAIAEAIATLDRALSAHTDIVEEAMDEAVDEEAERDYVSIRSRAVPLRDMLLHAQHIDSYVMWRPE